MAGAEARVKRPEREALPAETARAQPSPFIARPGPELSIAGRFEVAGAAAAEHKSRMLEVELGGPITAQDSEFHRRRMNGEARRAEQSGDREMTERWRTMAAVMRIGDDKMDEAAEARGRGDVRGAEALEREAKVYYERALTMEATHERQMADRARFGDQMPPQEYLRAQKQIWFRGDEDSLKYQGALEQAGTAYISNRAALESEDQQMREARRDLFSHMGRLGRDAGYGVAFSRSVGRGQEAPAAEAQNYVQTIFAAAELGARLAKMAGVSDELKKTLEEMDEELSRLKKKLEEGKATKEDIEKAKEISEFINDAGAVLEGADESMRPALGRMLSRAGAALMSGKKSVAQAQRQLAREYVSADAEYRKKLEEWSEKLAKGKLTAAQAIREMRAYREKRMQEFDKKPITEKSATAFALRLEGFIRTRRLDREVEEGRPAFKRELQSVRELYAKGIALAKKAEAARAAGLMREAAEYEKQARAHLKAADARLAALEYAQKLREAKAPREMVDAVKSAFWMIGTENDWRGRLVIKAANLFLGNGPFFRSPAGKSLLGALSGFMGLLSDPKKKVEKEEAEQGFASLERGMRTTAGLDLDIGSILKELEGAPAGLVKSVRNAKSFIGTDQQWRAEFVLRAARFYISNRKKFAGKKGEALLAKMLAFVNMIGDGEQKMGPEQQKEAGTYLEKLARELAGLEAPAPKMEERKAPAGKRAPAVRAGEKKIEKRARTEEDVRLVGRLEEAGAPPEVISAMVALQEEQDPEKRALAVRAAELYLKNEKLFGIEQMAGLKKALFGFIIALGDAAEKGIIMDEAKKAEAEQYLGKMEGAVHEANEADRKFKVELLGDTINLLETEYSYATDPQYREYLEKTIARAYEFRSRLENPETAPLITDDEYKSLGLVFQVAAEGKSLLENIADPDVRKKVEPVVARAMKAAEEGRVEEAQAQLFLAGEYLMGYTNSAYRKAILEASANLDSSHDLEAAKDFMARNIASLVKVRGESIRDEQAAKAFLDYAEMLARDGHGMDLARLAEGRNAIKLADDFRDTERKLADKKYADVREGTLGIYRRAVDGFMRGESFQVMNMQITYAHGYMHSDPEDRETMEKMSLDMDNTLLRLRAGELKPDSPEVQEVFSRAETYLDLEKRIDGLRSEQKKVGKGTEEWKLYEDAIVYLEGVRAKIARGEKIEDGDIRKVNLVLSLFGGEAEDISGSFADSADEGEKEKQLALIDGINGMGPTLARVTGRSREVTAGIYRKALGAWLGGEDEKAVVFLRTAQASASGNKRIRADAAAFAEEYAGGGLEQAKALWISETYMQGASMEGSAKSKADAERMWGYFSIVIEAYRSGDVNGAGAGRQVALTYAEAMSGDKKAAAEALGYAERFLGRGGAMRKALDKKISLGEELAAEAGIASPIPADAAAHLAALESDTARMRLSNSERKYSLAVDRAVGSSDRDRREKAAQYNEERERLLARAKAARKRGDETEARRLEEEAARADYPAFAAQGAAAKELYRKGVAFLEEAIELRKRAIEEPENAGKLLEEAARKEAYGRFLVEQADNMLLGLEQFDRSMTGLWTIHRERGREDIWSGITAISSIGTEFALNPDAGLDQSRMARLSGARKMITAGQREIDTQKGIQQEKWRTLKWFDKLFEMNEELRNKGYDELKWEGVDSGYEVYKITYDRDLRVTGRVQTGATVHNYWYIYEEIQRGRSLAKRENLVGARRVGGKVSSRLKWSSEAGRFVQENERLKQNAPPDGMRYFNSGLEYEMRLSQAWGHIQIGNYSLANRELDGISEDITHGAGQQDMANAAYGLRKRAESDELDKIADSFEKFDPLGQLGFGIAVVESARTLLGGGSLAEAAKSFEGLEVPEGESKLDSKALEAYANFMHLIKNEKRYVQVREGDQLVLYEFTPVELMRRRVELQKKQLIERAELIESLIPEVRTAQDVVLGRRALGNTYADPASLEDLKDPEVVKRYTEDWVARSALKPPEERTFTEGSANFFLAFSYEAAGHNDVAQFARDVELTKAAYGEAVSYFIPAHMLARTTKFDDYGHDLQGPVRGFLKIGDAFLWNAGWVDEMMTRNGGNMNIPGTAINFGGTAYGSGTLNAGGLEVGTYAGYESVPDLVFYSAYGYHTTLLKMSGENALGYSGLSLSQDVGKYQGEFARRAVMASWGYGMNPENGRWERLQLTEGQQELVNDIVKKYHADKQAVFGDAIKMNDYVLTDKTPDYFAKKARAAHANSRAMDTVVGSSFETRDEVARVKRRMAETGDYEERYRMESYLRDLETHGADAIKMWEAYRKADEYEKRGDAAKAEEWRDYARKLRMGTKAADALDMAEQFEKRGDEASAKWWREFAYEHKGYGAGLELAREWHLEGEVIDDTYYMMQDAGLTEQWVGPIKVVGYGIVIVTTGGTGAIVIGGISTTEAVINFNDQIEWAGGYENLSTKDKVMGWGGIGLGVLGTVAPALGEFGLAAHAPRLTAALNYTLIAGGIGMSLVQIPDLMRAYERGEMSGLGLLANMFATAQPALQIGIFGLRPKPIRNRFLRYTAGVLFGMPTSDKMPELLLNELHAKAYREMPAYNRERLIELDRMAGGLSTEESLGVMNAFGKRPIDMDWAAAMLDGYRKARGESLVSHTEVRLDEFIVEYMKKSPPSPNPRAREALPGMIGSGDGRNVSAEGEYQARRGGEPVRGAEEPSVVVEITRGSEELEGSLAKKRAELEAAGWKEEDILLMEKAARELEYYRNMPPDTVPPQYRELLKRPDTPVELALRYAEGQAFVRDLPPAIAGETRVFISTEGGRVALQIVQDAWGLDGFRAMHPSPADGKIYHDWRHTLNVGAREYELAIARGLKHEQAKYLAEVSMLHDMDPTRRAGTQARAAATIEWMDSPEGQKIMRERFGWDDRRIDMAKAIIQRTEFPFDNARTGQNTSLGFPRNPVPVYEGDASLQPGAPERIGERYSNSSPREHYEKMLEKLSPEDRGFVLREAPILSEYADKVSWYMEGPAEGYDSVLGLGAEMGGRDMVPGTIGFLGSIGRPESFSQDAEIAKKFGLDPKIPLIGDVYKMLKPEQQRNWDQNAYEFALRAAGTDPVPLRADPEYQRQLSRVSEADPVEKVFVAQELAKELPYLREARKFDEELSGWNLKPDEAAKAKLILKAARGQQLGAEETKAMLGLGADVQALIRPDIGFAEIIKLVRPDAQKAVAERPAVTEEEMVSDAARREIERRGGTWMVGGEEVSPGEQVSTGKILRTVEDIIMGNAMSGEEVDIIVVTGDKRKLNQLNQLFGRDVGDHALDAYREIFGLAVADAAGEGARFLIRPSQSGDEAIGIIIVPKGRGAEVRAKFPASLDAATNNVYTKVTAEGAPLHGAAGLLRKPRDAVEALVDVSEPVLVRRVEMPDGSVKVVALHPDGSDAMVTRPGGRREFLTVQVRAAEEEGSAAHAPGLRKKLNTPAKPEIESRTELMGPEERASGVAFELKLSVVDPAVLADMEGLLPTTGKGLYEVANNAFGIRGLNTFLGHQGANGVVQHVENAVGAYAARNGLKIRRVGTLKYVIEGGNEAQVAGLRRFVDASLQEAGIGLRTAAAKPKAVTDANPAMIEGQIANGNLGLEWTSANYDNANAAISAMAIGNDDALARIFGPGHGLGKVIDFIRAHPEVRNYSDLFTALRSGKISGVDGPAMERAFSDYILGHGNEFARRLGELPLEAGAGGYETAKSLRLDEPESLADFARKVVLGDGEALVQLERLPPDIREPVDRLIANDAFRAAAKSDRMFKSYVSDRTGFGRRVLEGLSAEVVAGLKRGGPGEGARGPGEKSFIEHVAELYDERAGLIFGGRQDMGAREQFIESARRYEQFLQENFPEPARRSALLKEFYEFAGRQLERISALPEGQREQAMGQFLIAQEYFVEIMKASPARAGEWLRFMQSIPDPVAYAIIAKRNLTLTAENVTMTEFRLPAGDAKAAKKFTTKLSKKSKLSMEDIVKAIPEEWFEDTGLSRKTLLKKENLTYANLNKVLSPHGFVADNIRGNAVVAEYSHSFGLQNQPDIGGYVIKRVVGGGDMFGGAAAYFNPYTKSIFMQSEAHLGAGPGGAYTKAALSHENQHFFDDASGVAPLFFKKYKHAEALERMESLAIARESIEMADSPGLLDNYVTNSILKAPQEYKMGWKKVKEILDADPEWREWKKWDRNDPKTQERIDAMVARAKRRLADYIDGEYEAMVGLKYSEVYGERVFGVVSGEIAPGGAKAPQKKYESQVIRLEAGEALPPAPRAEVPEISRTPGEPAQSEAEQLATDLASSPIKLKILAQGLINGEPQASRAVEILGNHPAAEYVKSLARLYSGEVRGGGEVSLDAARQYSRLIEGTLGAKMEEVPVPAATLENIRDPAYRAETALKYASMTEPRTATDRMMMEAIEQRMAETGSPREIAAAEVVDEVFSYASRNEGERINVAAERARAQGREVTAEDLIYEGLVHREVTRLGRREGISQLAGPFEEGAYYIAIHADQAEASGLMRKYADTAAEISSRLPLPDVRDQLVFETYADVFRLASKLHMEGFENPAALLSNGRSGLLDVFPITDHDSYFVLKEAVETTEGLLTRIPNSASFKVQSGGKTTTETRGRADIATDVLKWLYEDMASLRGADQRMRYLRAFDGEFVWEASPEAKSIYREITAGPEAFVEFFNKLRSQDPEAQQKLMKLRGHPAFEAIVRINMDGLAIPAEGRALGQAELEALASPPSGALNFGEHYGKMVQDQAKSRKAIWKNELPILAYVVQDRSGTVPRELWLSAFDNDFFRKKLENEANFGAMVDFLHNIDSFGRERRQASGEWLKLAYETLLYLNIEEGTTLKKPPQIFRELGKKPQRKAALDSILEEGIQRRKGEKLKESREHFIGSRIVHLNRIRKMGFGVEDRVVADFIRGLRGKFGRAEFEQELGNRYVEMYASDARMGEPEREALAKFAVENSALFLQIYAYRKNIERFRNRAEIGRDFVGEPGAFVDAVPVLDQALVAQAEGRFAQFKYSEDFRNELIRLYGPELGRRVFEAWSTDTPALARSDRYDIYESGSFEEGFNSGIMRNEKTCQNPQNGYHVVGGLVGMMELPWMKQVVVREPGAAEASSRTWIMLVHGDDGRPVLLVQSQYQSATVMDGAEARTVREDTVRALREKYGPLGVEVKVFDSVYTAEDPQAGNYGYSTYSSGRSPLFYIDSNMYRFRTGQNVSGHHGLHTRTPGEPVDFGRGWARTHDVELRDDGR